MTRNIISVSWVSYNNDPYEREKDGSYREREGMKSPGPTLELLFNPKSPVAGQIKKHYLFVRRPRTAEWGARSVHPRESDVAGELISAIDQQESAPDVKVIYWDTDASPTDHRELFLFTAQALANIRRENQKAKIIVNISPGTPAAQTVLLLALQARIAGDNILAYQGIPHDKRRSEEEVVREVRWDLLAELAATATEIGDGGRLRTAWSFDNARSQALRKVAEKVKQYGGVPFPVLIKGARGTGKTEVARRLREGFREWKTLLQNEWNFHVNCAEFRGDANMLRSALFGHEKNAFTGANAKKDGLLTLAAQDCVFLDEIHWMDPQAQGLLLVALQRNGRIRSIGGDESKPAEFRLIAATNQPQNILREKLVPDFLDRISDLVIELPELRDCREDLGDIWTSVVRNACEELVLRDPARAIGSAGTRHEEYAAQFRPHNADIVRAISSMRLAGNFRDLEKLARRLITRGLGIGRFLSLSKELVRDELDQLRKGELADEEQAFGPATSLVDELPTIARCEDYLREVKHTGTVLSGEKTISEWERRLLVAAHEVGGSGTKAAELLGMIPRTFNNRMQKYDAVSPQGSRR